MMVMMTTTMMKEKEEEVFTLPGSAALSHLILTKAQMYN